MKLIFIKILNKTRKFINKLFFKKQTENYYAANAAALNNENFTIISSNCTGGFVYHERLCRFNSPTINLYFDAPDFICFCENISNINNLPFEEITSTGSYPMARVGNAKIHLFHYATYEEAKEKWEKRAARVNFDNLFIVWTDRDGFTEDLLPRFAALPFKKVFFSHKPYSQYSDFTVYLPRYKSWDSVDDLTRYASCKGERTYSKYFDFTAWLNGKSVKESII